MGSKMIRGHFGGRGYDRGNANIQARENGNSLGVPDRGRLFKGRFRGLFLPEACFFGVDFFGVDFFGVDFFGVGFFEDKEISRKAGVFFQYLEPSVRSAMAYMWPSVPIFRVAIFSARAQ